MKECCQSCRFWYLIGPINHMEPSLSVDFGMCRVNPPNIDWDDQHGIGVYPKTEYSNWCGKFEAKKDDGK